MSTGKRIVRNDGEGDKRWFYGGGLHTWKLTADDTGGALVLFEDQMTEGKVTPLHRHPEFDEMLYVLEGSILIQIDGEDQPVGPGGTTFAPRGVPHAFTVTSPMVRLLCMQTPGSGQPFYEGASDPTTQTEPTGPVDFDRVRQAAADSGATEILGPPPFTARQAADRVPGP
jgi:quercetin dioxygenase-like cupin family protein